MTKLKIGALALTLTLQFALAALVQPQDAETITATGSAIVNPSLSTLAEASGARLDIQDTGSAAGIDAFCNGAIDLATATRPMSSAERAICGANDVAASEFLLGHHLVVFVAGADVPLDCLRGDQLSDLLKPSASNSLDDWSFVEAESELALTLALPPPDQIAYFIVDGLVVGDGLRRDTQRIESSADAMAFASETAGGIAIAAWTDAFAAAEGLRLLDFGAEAAGACGAPSAEAVESGDYQAALLLYLYVNRARLEANESLDDFLRIVLDSAAAGDLAEGVIPVSSARVELNRAALEGGGAGSGLDDQLDSIINLGELSGELTIVGAANSFAALESAGNELSRLNSGLTVTFDLAGSAAGMARLCAGEADIAAVDAEASDACDDGVATRAFGLGAQATVLISNAEDESLACLTTEQSNRIWRAESANEVTDWAQVDDSFAAQDITLFGLSSPGLETDILLQTAGAPIPPARRDTERNHDPLYRAAAVANVRGALTYMTWSDYNRALENEQANIRLVAVDGGAGCELPSLETIGSGAYALARSASVVAREDGLAGDNTQAFLASLFGDDNWHAIERAGLIGLSQLDLPVIRGELHRAFAQAAQNFAPPPADAESESGQAAETEASG